MIVAILEAPALGTDGLFIACYTWHIFGSLQASNVDHMVPLAWAPNSECL